MSRPQSYATRNTPGLQSPYQVHPKPSYPGQPPQHRPYTNGQPALSSRTLVRDKWARIFGGPAYLEPGTSNRLVLSIRSPLGAEIDWALDRLVQVSGTDPDLVRLPEFPGLLDSLLHLVQAWLDALPPKDSATLAWNNKALALLRHRAVEAALVLHNLAPEPSSFAPLKASKKLPRVIVDVLSVGDADVTSEIRLAFLEVLEVIGEHVPMILPGRALNPDDDPEPADSPSVRLFPLLVELTCSSDRALVISSFRCLTVLSVNDKSDPVVALLTFPAHAPYPHPIDTAVSLLPLFDTELSLTCLDFIYQHSLLPANAVAFCARPDLSHVLKLVCSKLHQGARKEAVEVTIPVKDTDAESLYRRSAPNLYNRPARLNEPKELSAAMSKPELNILLALPEPSRALNWMRLAFEEYPTGEITQVALWTAYRSEFEPHVTTERPMLPAADVVKMSTEAFPNALPMVTETSERKFIIRGIRVRDRTDMKAVFTCRWQGCRAPIGPTTPELLYWHIHHMHLSPAVVPSCLWTKCHFTSQSMHPSSDLSLHVRTHIPLYHPPPGYGDTPPASGPPPSEPVSTMRYERYHAESKENELTGLALLGCLVLRNVARTVRTALGRPGAAEMAGAEESIFEAFSAAEEGNGQKDEVMAKLEKVDFEPAKQGKKSLDALESDLVMATMQDHLLGSKVLCEVLGVIVNGGRA